MSIKAYNAFFTEPPQNSNNYVGVSNGEHPAIISLFRPNTNIITSIFLLVQNTTLALNSSKTNSLKLSIIDLDSSNSYLPTNHSSAASEAAKNQNSFNTYVTELHDNSLSGVISKTNIYFSGTQTWIEFKFTAGFITNTANELDPNKYYGILISDTSQSNISNKIFYSDKSYSQSSLNRTLYLTTDDGSITWQNYQTGDNNVQICVAYPKDELSSSNSLDYGTISTGGSNYKRNTGLGMFLRNTSSSDKFFVDNFAMVPDDGDDDIGLENFTYNSAFSWSYFDKNTLPSTSVKVQSGKQASTGINVELDPDDYVFFYQKDWVSPIPVRYLTKSARQLIYNTYPGGLDSLDGLSNGVSARSKMENPARRFEYDLIKLDNEKYTQEINSQTLFDAKVFSTDYPGISISSGDLQDIKVNQILENSDGDITFNSFEAVPFNTDKFINSNTGIAFESEFFEDNSIYLNTSRERSEWQSENSLSTREKGSTGMLKSYGILLDSDNSTNSKWIFDNNKLFPDTADGSIVTDTRSICMSYHSDADSTMKFPLTRNNTINLEGVKTYSTVENSLKYRLVYQHSHADDSFPWPPHLVLRNYNSGSYSQNLVLGGVCLYTSSYSDYQGDLDMSSSKVQTGLIGPSKTSIIDSNLGYYEIPIAKTSISDATNVYGKGLSLTIHQDSALDANSTTMGFYDQKYLIRHIVDNVITIEGKILAYGLCTVSFDPNTETLTTTLRNISSEDVGDWSNFTENPNFRLALNPFGLLFDNYDITTGTQDIDVIYNDGDPIKLVNINSIDTSAKTITSTGVTELFWKALFPTTYQNTTYHSPHWTTFIPFYIIETPQGKFVNASSAKSSVSLPAYGAADPGWIGVYPDYFQAGGQIYSVGYHVAGGNDPASFYIAKEGATNALLPTPSDGEGIGYSVTFPYIENANDLSSLNWLSTLFAPLGTDMTNVDMNQDDIIDVYDNPAEKFRSKKLTSTTYHQYHLLDPFTSANTPENIFKTIEYTELKNIGDAVQIHISEYDSDTDYYDTREYKHMSFIYSVESDESTSTSSTCELSLQAHSDNFIVSTENPVVNLIPSIVLNSTGTKSDNQITSSLDSIFSHSFDSPVNFNDYILKRTGGDAPAQINNIVMFDDMAVYGKCVNPVNIWRQTNGTSNLEFCKLPSNGYVVIDLGLPRHVGYMEFSVSKSETSIKAYNDGEIEFTISGLDPNVSSDFQTINTPTSVTERSLTGVSSLQSFIKTKINRTVKYLVIQPSNSTSPVYLQNLKVQVEDLEVYVYDKFTLDRYSFTPAYTLGSIDAKITYPVAQPKNYKYATYPYEHSSIFATIDPFTITGIYGAITTDDNRYNSLYIPVGKTTDETPHTFVSGDDLDDVITTTNAITQISFNIKQRNKTNISPTNSFLFKLYSSTGTNPGGGGDLVDSSFTLKYSIFATPYSREPEEGFYTISSIGENTIYLDTTDIIFANNNLQGYMARLDIFRDIYVEVTKSGITNSGQSWIEIRGSTNGLGLIPGGQMYLEKSNVLSFPAFKATWLKLEYVNTLVPIDIFGLRVYTSILDQNNDPVDVTASAFSSLSWNLQINNVQD